MQLAVTAFAVSLALATPTPTLVPTLAPTATPRPTFTPVPATATATLAPTLTPTTEPTATATAIPAPTSQLPQTTPGLSRDEGVFLVTAANDGSRAIYFIAGNQRHSILTSDLELEMRLNPLWPIRFAEPGEVLSFAEGAPVGAAHAGLLNDASAPAPAPAPAVAQDAPAAAPPAPAPAVAQDAPAAAPAVVADAPQPIVYVLRPGDTLTRISMQYGVSIQAMLDANGIANMNRVYVGQSLIIPTTATPQAPDVVEPPAAQPPVADVPAAAETAAAAQDQTAATDDTAAADQPQTYTVQRGDSAIQIARRFGVDEGALLNTNAIANPNRVYVGQVLTIPQ